MTRTITILLLLLSCLSVVAQKIKLADPIYLATTLIDDISIDRMKEACKNYGLMESEKENEFIVFADEKGNKLRFKVKEVSNERTPIVEVVSKTPHKEIIRILTDTGFSSSSHGKYVKGDKYAHRITICSFSKGILTFTKERR